ncbi:MAG TPA: hypothetical protein VKI45_04340 [Allosphingosinicella sp.]|nr:hypothetical protein [Allosphingosinicella sp.]
MGRPSASLGTNDVGGARAEAAVAPSGEGFVVRASKHRDVQVARVGKRKLFDKKRRKLFLECPGGSPDRADAMLWAMTELARRRAAPRITFL